MTTQSTFALVAPSPPVPHWLVDVSKSHPALLRLADGFDGLPPHYSRQTVGASLMTRPGVNLCMLLSDGSAGWVTWRPIPQVGRMDRLEAWECTFFRNIGTSIAGRAGGRAGGRLSSTLIVEAVDLTYRAWGWPPRDGFVTAIGVEQTVAHRSPWHGPGWCYRKAGWTPDVRFLDDSGEPTHIRDGKAWFRAPSPLDNARRLEEVSR